MTRGKVFTSGGSQAVRIPREFRIDTTEVTIERIGASLIITPVKPEAQRHTWLSWYEDLGEGESTIEREQPEEQERNWEL
ncbi:antitoxin [Deinococcus cellulosilyticus]|uniref:Antitoxin n=1 Tax=Deinococcus cellulosilyticus (strain DSM 18568 / NBRC 106333 / KACC 11606 / 5516J-15) TaxID=1223518 RepID=A0A511MXZ3_DEIC1|nr:AbrB/MazE/SpoVT family DNA-binding domain-containing protein [Deinococcus cellulosilyticus]GEM45462.1 antitoxin [Deinococcus cellulosilyticus NBRC 106333 = KACC 11606]